MGRSMVVGTVRRAMGAAAWVCVMATPMVASAQDGGVIETCGTELTPAEAARGLMLQRAGAYNAPAQGPRGLCRIPMTMHVVRRGDGTGGLEQNWVDECIADANAQFAPMGVSFFQAGPTITIDSDALYNINITDETNILRQLFVVPGTINVYFVGSATYCGISSFTFSTVQGIVINNACTPREGNRSTFPHEVGHYFDLFHTQDRTYGVECPSGSNCATAGDLVCDTPADPGLSNVVNPECQYTGSAAPPCGEGVPYNPDTRNLMSYARHQCRVHFSQGQYDRMTATLVNLRPELVCLSPSCPADWNDDEAVNSDDIVLFLTGWLASISEGTLGADFNGDEAVNSEDITVYLTFWLAAIDGTC